MTTENGTNGNQFSAFAPKQNPQPDRRLLEAWTGLRANAYSISREFFKNLIDPRRNIEDECGYPGARDSIPAQVYQDLYDREPIPARVVDVYPRECWQTTPSVFEKEAGGETPFDQAMRELGQSLRGEACWFQDEEGSPVWDYLKRADILSGIGRFGILLLGLDDGMPLDQPVATVAGEKSPPAANVVRVTANGRKVQRKLRRQALTLNQLVALERPGNCTFSRVAVKEQTKNGETVEREIVSNADAAAATKKLKSACERWSRGLTANDTEPSPNQGLGRQTPGDDDWTMEQYAKVGTEALYQTTGFAPEAPNGKQSKGPRLLFLRVFPEAMVQIVQYESNVRSPRFGQPVRYSVTLNDPRDQHAGIGLPTATVYVHWTRVIHIAEVTDTSGEVCGVPRMRPVLNRLIDLRKLYGGSAEMYWRGAFPGVVAETQPNAGDVNIDWSDLRNQLENWTHSMQRVLGAAGVSFRMLNPTVVDPSPQIGTQLEAICIKLGIPKRIFMGSERGELASGQDDSAWNDRLRERRDGYITPRIIVPFVDRLIAVGVLPTPQGYSVEWSDLESLSDQDRANVANTRMGVVAQYIASGAEAMVSPRKFWTEFMDMDEEKADAMLAESQGGDPQTVGALEARIKLRQAEAEAMQAEIAAETAQQEAQAAAEAAANPEPPPPDPVAEAEAEKARLAVEAAQLAVDLAREKAKIARQQSKQASAKTDQESIAAEQQRDQLDAQRETAQRQREREQEQQAPPERAVRKLAGGGRTLADLLAEPDDLLASNIALNESYFATCQRGPDGKCLPKGEAGAAGGGGPGTESAEPLPLAGWTDDADLASAYDEARTAAKLDKPDSWFEQRYDERTATEIAEARRVAAEMGLSQMPDEELAQTYALEKSALRKLASGLKRAMKKTSPGAFQRLGRGDVFTLAAWSKAHPEHAEAAEELWSVGRRVLACEAERGLRAEAAAVAGEIKTARESERKTVANVDVRSRRMAAALARYRKYLRS
ncbi:MAG TPA: anti-CBASS Acb1 family protein [Aquabacterium sp.]|nr:anti-CBASS Acb1 family protein [Aquabacterium sp.]